MTSRRMLLAGLAGMAPLLALTGCRATPAHRARLRVTLVGQALMEYPICALGDAELAGIVSELADSDVLFTNLEVAIRTAQSGLPTRDNQFLHVADTDVLACLRSLRFNIMALSNNHAWDLDTAGVLATRAAVLAHGFAAAGTGANIVEASAASMLTVRRARIALVAMATAKIQAGAAATTTRAGVNELRLDERGQPETEDAARNLEAISRASAAADIVIAYHHNHDWGENMAVTRPWARDWARRCVDAGAALYASHGAPLLHGIERYRGKALFLGLGSFVFHSRTAPGHYPPEVWESAIVHCDFEGDQLQSVQLVPLLLNERSDDPEGHVRGRGRPRIARGNDAARVLERLRLRSNEFDTRVVIAEDRGSVL